MCALYGLFNMSINNPFIAAILTVVGYSINDTIVVFDRIRENVLKIKKTDAEHIIDTSINQTLVRSVMTSLTTVFAIMPLVILGGESIREFTLPLIIGIIAGTFSSIFIASPIYFDILKRTSKGRGYLELYAAKPKEDKPKKSLKGDGAVV
jgi:SecD/SecF fusion protein